MGIHKGLCSGEEVQKGIVLGRTGVIERLMEGALVHWWRLQYGSFPQ